MADSLRDQLLKAGFSTPTPDPEKRSGSKKKKKARKPPQRSRPSAAGTGKHASRHSSTLDPEAQKRKALKAQIKLLIEKDLVEKYAGEAVYRYVLGTRIRELHVTPEVHKRLVDGVLSVTRLNGNTCIVTAETVEAIRQINPEWAIMKPARDTETDIEGYEQFQVPDDLQW